MDGYLALLGGAGLTLAVLTMFVASCCVGPRNLVVRVAKPTRKAGP